MSRQIFDFVYSIFQKNDAAAIPGAPSALSAKYYRWNSNARRERGSRRKRISSISQRVAVTVSVMAFGSVVESYSCANPIRALLRVYFRTRVACTYVRIEKARWEYHERFTISSIYQSIPLQKFFFINSKIFKIGLI